MEQVKKKKGTWGGARPGAGRPRKPNDGTEKRKHSVYVTRDELVVVRDFIKKYREAKIRGEREVRYPIES